ncbi:MAG TPA: outer membrane beta-barrel protein [Steroidobacteraceae bacterium]|nr:outer membrane beta-barrel protein [Steroidobacteraceae bacterium]
MITQTSACHFAYVSLFLAASSTALAQTPANPAPAQSGPAMSAAAGLLIYPKNGQTQEQQSADRYACHSWAQGQTGFDPTEPNSGASPSDLASRRSNYRRAMSACLEARGYSVRYASPQVAPLPPPASPVPPPARPLRLEHYEAPRSTSPALAYHPFQVHIDGGYTIATGTTNQNFDNGGNAGLGFTWFPTSALPLGLRVDGNYSWFRAKDNFLNSTAGNFTRGWLDIYGGDADLQLDLAHQSSRAKLYLFGGLGWYRERTDLRQVSIVSGTVCGFYFCEPGYFPAVTAEQISTSNWQKSWNAGLGLEVAIAPRAAFFVEARYQHFLPNRSNSLQFVPIRMGLRF